MESFNREEHVVAAFLDVEKAFDNVWHNGLRYKIFMIEQRLRSYPEDIGFMNNYQSGFRQNKSTDGHLSLQAFPVRYGKFQQGRTCSGCILLLT